MSKEDYEKLTVSQLRDRLGQTNRMVISYLQAIDVLLEKSRILSELIDKKSDPTEDRMTEDGK